MHKYIHVSMCACIIYVCVHVHMYVGKNPYACMHICMYASMHKSICI